MTSARSAILDRVRRARKTGHVPVVRRPASPVDVDATTVGTRPESRLDRFTRELQALGVSHHVASTAEEARALVKTIVDGRAVFSWEADRLPYDVGSVLGPANITGASARESQAAAEIGVTGCHGAIAETGSVVILSGPGMPRAASLLPPTHLCLVRRGDLYLSVAAFFRARAADIAAAACCTFITGPSRTADIELTLTVGVHGPGAVVVVIGP